MQVQEVLHGFRLIYTQELPELNATLYRMRYDKNGADLVWLRRPDDNKTFTIAFKTIPHDHTGVFHILEHSVLCGSEKYPVKEPFVELLKSSLQTFLNAFTFPDKTAYPVCSRNDRDFLNLIDVYMDAVLHPLSITDPHAFLQEGWHYELDSPEGELRCNGVVYNEMKGSYASPDTVLDFEMNRLLFPDTCYCWDSGGHPEHITELTYEDYLESHHRFYHPSNSRIFLDGDIPLDAVLEKLDSFLRDYEALDVQAEIPMQQPVNNHGLCHYEIGPEDDLENKVILSRGWVFGDYSQMEKNLACSVLTEVLCGTNEAPLKKVLLEKGLAQDVEFQTLDGIQQLYVLLVVRNTREAQVDEVWGAVEQVLRDQAENGVDRTRLRAVLNRLEFATREKDFGSMPQGLVYGLNALETWLYGGDPCQNLCYEAVFKSLREKLEQGFFEEFLKEALLYNPHQATLTMLPSKTLGEEKRDKEQTRLEAIRSSWDCETVRQVMEDFRILREKQALQDTPEQLAALPQLSLKDIPETVRESPQTVEEIDGVTLLHQDVVTNGILYLDLFFSLADLPPETLSLVTFFSRLLGQVATEQYDVNALRTEMEANLGRLAAGTRVFSVKDETGEATPCLVVSVAVLEGQKQQAVRLLREVLLRSKFSDSQIIYNFLRQMRLELEQSVAASGNAYGRQRIAASFSALGVVSEAISGIEFLRWLQRTDKRFADSGAAFCEQLSALSQHLFSGSRLTISLTGAMDRAWLTDIRKLFPDVPMEEREVYTPAGIRREGFLIPADISFAVRGSHFRCVDAHYSAAAALSAQILSYGYLWNTLRVQGGAYGAGMAVKITGEVQFSTYRDPSGDQSLTLFEGAADALRQICDSGEPLDKYIISTIGTLDPLMSPRMVGQQRVGMYFTGRTIEDRKKLRHDLLHATPEQLRAFADVLDRVFLCSSVCVIGGKAVLDACGDALDSVEPLQVS